MNDQMREIMVTKLANTFGRIALVWLALVSVFDLNLYSCNTVHNVLSVSLCGSAVFSVAGPRANRCNFKSEEKLGRQNVTEVFFPTLLEFIRNSNYKQMNKQHK